MPQQQHTRFTPAAVYSFLEEIIGLKAMSATNNNQLSGVMQLLMEMRKEAKAKKDYAISDKIRNQLSGVGIVLKDEKDGSMSWDIN